MTIRLAVEPRNDIYLSVNEPQKDYQDFYYIFSDIPTNKFYPTNLQTGNSRYTISDYPICPNGTNTLHTRITYIKDSGITGIINGPASIITMADVITHDEIAAGGKLNFVGGGCLSTTPLHFSKQGNTEYYEISPVFHYGIIAPVPSIGNDNDTYLNQTTGLLHTRVLGVWDAGIPFGDANSTISGTGAPIDPIGVDGNYYLDISDSTIYGPKTLGTWVGAATISLHRGGAYLTGTGVPPALDGIIGDYFLNTTTGILYGPKIILTDWVGVTEILAVPKGQILTGVGVSVMLPTFGEDGAFFLDTASGYLYGPKASGIWPISNYYNISNGGRIRIGTGVPSPLLGENGDTFFDTSTLEMYGPKAAGVWPTAVSLSGPIGPAGNTILSGISTPTAGTGDDGDFYIDKSSSILYGPKSPTTVWSEFVQLTAGSNTILNGPEDPSVLIGQTGDFYINTSTKVMYGPKTIDSVTGLGVWIPVGGFGRVPTSTADKTLGTILKDVFNAFIDFFETIVDTIGLSLFLVIVFAIITLIIYYAYDRYTIYKSPK